MDPNGLRSMDQNTEPATHHQTGSAANLGNKPSSFHHDHLHPSEDDDNNLPPLVPHKETNPDDLDDDSSPILQELQPGPIHPNPHQINLAQHQQWHSKLQKQMVLHFQECNEFLPSIDPIHAAMLTIDRSIFQLSTVCNPPHPSH